MYKIHTNTKRENISIAGSRTYLEDGLMLYYAFDRDLNFVSKAPAGAEAPTGADTSAPWKQDTRFPSQYVLTRGAFATGVDPFYVRPRLCAGGGSRFSWLS